MKHISLRLGGPVLLMGLLALLLTLGGTSRAAAADTNTIQSIKATGKQVAITLTSTKPFDVRDDILTLQIGASTFTVSGYPPDGDLNTVIFTLTSAQYAATKTGDPVSVYFASSSGVGTDAWNFGSLNKSLATATTSTGSLN